ncbi:MAG TPA: TIGR00730 family Rossman fold protein [Caulobacteraceae bacterium]|nr:TIGR00730 family Rossman fold protein [Caulobacteraceae bacterium]
MELCIYCGTAFGDDPAYLAAAKATATLLAREGIGVVYGGAKVGLMGAVADAALAAGGKVTGVMPRSLIEREIAHAGLTVMHVTESMHERKALMEQISDGFIALPGGPGTLDEMVEQWTWGLLGIHAKPCGFLNVKGYFEPLRQMTQRMVDAGFVAAKYADMLIFAEDPAELLARFRSYVAPAPKWADASEPVRP